MNPFSDLIPGGSGGSGNTGAFADLIPAGSQQPQQPKQSFSDQIWSSLVGAGKAVGNVLGGNGIGNSLGTAAFDTGQLVQGKNPFRNPATNASGMPVGGMNPAANAHPLQEAGDILRAGSTVSGFGAAPASLAGTIAAGAGTGAAQLGGASLAKGDSLGTATENAGIGALTGGAVSGGVYGLGHLVGAAGDKIMSSVIKPSRADITDGFSVQTLKDYNLGGSLNTTLDKTQAALDDLSRQLNDKLGAAGTKINLNDVVNQTINELTDASKLKGFGANAKIASTLEQLKNEAGIVAEDGNLSIPDAQVVKQAAGNFGAWQYGKVDAESKASEIVYNTFYNKLKTAIENGSPEGVKDINQQLSKLIPVQNAVLRRLPVAERAGLISLNDMIGLVGSTMHPAALGPTVLNLISRSGAAGSLLSKLGPAASRLAVPATTAATSIGSQAIPAAGTSE